MAKGVTELLLKITGDNREAVKKLNEIDGKMSRTADNFMAAAKTMAAAFVASKVVDFGKDAVDAALRAEEAANKFKVVFGPAVEEAGEFVDDYAQRLGMSSGELTGLLGSIGAVVSGMGTATEDVAGLATDIATLGADLASFHDKDVEQAISSITSALTGERESLKTSFGIVIKEADVVKQALIDTGKESAAELTNLDKVMATMALVTIKADLQGAIGDLDHTMDDNVAKIRDLQGAYKQFQEDIGQAIIPVLEEILPALQDVLPALSDLATALLQTVVPAFVAAVEAAEPFIDAIVWLSERGAEGMESFRVESEDEMGLWEEALDNASGSVGKFFDGVELFEQSKEFYAGLWDRLTGAASDFDEELRNQTWADRWQAQADHFQQATEDQILPEYDDLVDKSSDYLGVLRDINDAHLAATDPLFGAIDAVKRWEDALEEANEDGKITDEELIKIAEHALGANAALLKLHDGDVNAAIEGLMSALGLTREEANSLAWRLGVIDRTDVRPDLDDIDIRNGNTQAKQLIDYMNYMNGLRTYSSHTNTIRTVYETVNSGTTYGHLEGYQHGGITPGGPVLVGERGPEIVNLPSGSKVNTNHESRHMGTGESGITVNVYGSVITERDLAETVARKLNQHGRRNGWN